MPKYVLKRGRHMGTDSKGERREFKVGDVVELTPQQAQSFGDRFESFEAMKARQKTEKEEIDILEATERAKVAAMREEQENAHDMANAMADANTQVPASVLHKQADLAESDEDLDEANVPASAQETGTVVRGKEPGKTSGQSDNKEQDEGKAGDKKAATKKDK